MTNPKSELQEYQELMEEAVGTAVSLEIGPGCEIRDFRLWHRALTSHEHQVIYNQEKESEG